MKIDWWTLGLQAINVLVLLWVLQRFLFKPVQAMIARRQQATQQLMADAAAAKRHAEEERAALDAHRQELAAGREKVLQAARAEAQQARDALLLQAGQDVQQRRAVAAAVLQRERAEALGELRTKAVGLAGDMARHLLERIPPTTWSLRFVEGACDQLTSLGSAEQAMLREDAQRPVEVVSAEALDEPARATVRGALGRVFGREPSIAFHVDPTLIAGVELRLPHRVIRNHWAADLEHVREQLQRDDHPA